MMNRKLVSGIAAFALLVGAALAMNESSAYAGGCGGGLFSKLHAKKACGGGGLLAKLKAKGIKFDVRKVPGDSQDNMDNILKKAQDELNK